MNTSQIRRITEQIEALGGVWTGHPARLEERFSCEVGWAAFSLGFRGEIKYAPGGRVTVIAPGFALPENIQPEEDLWKPDPQKWAEFAGLFLLGEVESIGSYSGAYTEHREIIDPLAEAVDYAIASHHYPSVTNVGRDLHVYEIPEAQRSLWYQADGERFSLYGRSMLDVA